MHRQTEAEWKAWREAIRQLKARTVLQARQAALFPELVAAMKPALALLDQQREEYNAAMSLLPCCAVPEGPIAHALRAVLAKAHELEEVKG